MSGIFEEMMDEIAQTPDTTDELLGESIEAAKAAEETAKEPATEETAEAAGVSDTVDVKVTPEGKKGRGKKAVVLVEDAPHLGPEDDEAERPLSEATRAEQEAGRALLATHAIFMAKLKAADEADAKAAARLAQNDE